MFKRVVKIAPLLFSGLICKQLDLHQKDTPKWFWFAKHQSDCQHCCIVVIYTLNTQNYASCNGLSSIKLKLFVHRRLLTKRYQWGSIILRSMPSVSFNKMSIHSLCQSNWPSFCSITHCSAILWFLPLWSGSVDMPYSFTKYFLPQLICLSMLGHSDFHEYIVHSCSPCFAENVFWN